MMTRRTILALLPVLLLIAPPARAAESAGFAGDTFIIYLLLNIAIGGMLVLFAAIFIDVWRDARRRRKERATTIEVDDRRRQGTRSAGYSYPTPRSPRAGEWTEKRRKVS